jgi:hypothetical protein
VYSSRQGPSNNCRTASLGLIKLAGLDERLDDWQILIEQPTSTLRASNLRELGNR